MTTYHVLFTLGAFLLVGALVLLVRSVRLYRAYDIRGVRDDLSGKARRRDIDAMRPARPVLARATSVTHAQGDAPTQIVCEEGNVGTQMLANRGMEGVGDGFSFDVVERMVLLGGMDGSGIEGEVL